ASAPPLSAASRKLRRVTFLCLMVCSSSRMFHSLFRQPEIAAHDLGPRLQLVGGSIIDDRALFHQKHARTKLKGGLDILLNQQDRNACLVDAVNFPPDL